MPPDCSSFSVQPSNQSSSWRSGRCDRKRDCRGRPHQVSKQPRCRRRSFPCRHRRWDPPGGLGWGQTHRAPPRQGAAERARRDRTGPASGPGPALAPALERGPGPPGQGPAPRAAERPRADWKSRLGRGVARPRHRDARGRGHP